jgi:hypothetical protein
MPLAKACFKPFGPATPAARPAFVERADNE